MATDEQLRTAFRILGESTQEQVPLPPSVAALRRPPRGSGRPAARLVPVLSAAAAVTVAAVVLVTVPSRDGGPGVVVTAPPASGPSASPSSSRPTTPGAVATPTGTTGTSGAPTAARPTGGTSAPSSGATSAPPSVPPSAPTAVQAVAGGPRAVVTWGPPASGAAAVTGYVVDAIDRTGTVTAASRVDRGTTRFVFESLAAGEYRLRVFVVTAAGTGPVAASDEISVRTVPQAPPVVTGVSAVGGGQLRVTWDAVPAAQSGNTPVTGYRVFAVDEAGNDVAVVTAAADATSTVLGLQGGRTYRVRLVTLNTFGGSVASPLSQAVTTT